MVGWLWLLILMLMMMMMMNEWGTDNTLRVVDSIFRNGGSSHQSSNMKGGEPSWHNSVTSVSNQGFDSTLRNLIDDSVQEEKSGHSLHGAADQDPAETPSTHG